MSWKKGPLPENTYGWGGVVPVGMGQAAGGFYFADFCGDHVRVVDDSGSKLKPHEVEWYDNSITVAPTGLKRLHGNPPGGN